ncbi:hypothetical protein DD237_003035 [Peronospora effusa]|uniref:Uncharacterized protein n=1 Tax=Peronospora effusa TaxID=542832 RepID=A0A425CFR0_9STRA|nr:hypothetical protein DD237_003035 [Peronospora effusa]
MDSSTTVRLNAGLNNGTTPKVKHAMWVPLSHKIKFVDHLHLRVGFQHRQLFPTRPLKTLTAAGDAAFHCNTEKYTV